MRKLRQAVVVVILVLLSSVPTFYVYLAGLWPEKGFVCPISYAEGIVTRNDPKGEGHFGARRRGGRKHKGIDLEAPFGAPVLATGTGKVIETGNDPGGYGHYVKMRHRDGFITIYAHLSEVVVKEGRIVHRGKIIGKVGKSGNASHKLIKPHVHLEIKKDGVAVDPLDYIKSNN